jgi:propanediol dehydratase large subunit
MPADTVASGSVSTVPDGTTIPDQPSSGLTYESMSTTDRRPQSLRSQFYATRPISRDNLVPEDPALGLVAFSSPFDPEPSLRIEDGRVVELDGKPEADFDLIDEFIALRCIDVDVADEAMAIETLEFARRLVDPSVSRHEVVRLVAGMTPAKIAQVLALLTPIEILQAMQKLRVRRTPSIQAHVTNRVDHPLLIAADAASAAAHGFRELETTVPVLRDAPANALALTVGGQVASAGALTQCAVEEAIELELGMRGLTTYAETVSVYGTEDVFVDGDDTPWSKAFLASCYASRGLKMRFTSGSGAEVLMGASEGKSMLYLEARCIAVTRAAGAQGVQNGGIDGVNVTASVPDGMREVIAENLCVMMHDLESCTGNDTLMSSSDIRRTAHTLPLLLAGSDFLFSGFGSIPAYDNAFGPSNFNAEDLDDYLVVQRDWGFEGGLRACDEEELLRVRPSRSSTSRPSPTRTSTRASSRTGRWTCRCYPATSCRARATGSWNAGSPCSTRCARWRRAATRSRPSGCSRCCASGCWGTSCRRRRYSTSTCASSPISATRTTTQDRAPATACPPLDVRKRRGSGRSGRRPTSPASRNRLQAACGSWSSGRRGRASVPTRSSSASRPPSARRSGWR